MSMFYKPPLGLVCQN